MFFGTFYTLFVLFNKLFIAREVVYFSVLLGSSWWLDLQLPMQSVPITTNFVSSNPVEAI
jgi:hypothetical protein